MATLATGGATGVRIAGYVRESADPSADRPAFAQQEELRRYAVDHGHDLVAVCRDVREPGHALGRAGYRSLLGVIASGSVDTVLVPGLETLADDEIVQEIMLWDLRSRQVRVLSTRPQDEAILDGGDPGPSRMVIRDVLARVAEYGRLAAAVPVEAPAAAPGAPGAGGVADAETAATTDVVIELR
jgi:DNA invertase Pin-like site-specific DNA recombinase